MLSKQAQNALIGWESHGPRIIKASFKTKKEGVSMNVIQCYASTNDYNEDAKDQFYNRLQSIIEKCPTKDLIILMGDLNAKVGTDNTGYEDIMGRHGLGERKESGERFANLCAFNKLVIGGTIVLKGHEILKIIMSLQIQLDETKGQLSRQSDYTGSRSPTTVAVSTISSSSRSGGTVQGSKIASSNSNISTTKRQTNNLVNNETNLGKSVQNVNFKDKSLIVNQVGELDASSGRGFLPPIDRNICDKFSLMTDGAVLQAKRREQKQSVENDKIENMIKNESMNIENSNLSRSVTLIIIRQPCLFSICLVS
ncbi:unnamed protein product [Schistosoma curassoni]|uniref:Endonuclease/exonuclease/phosphatase domain-containing protein n=1 Tax=Schistosoma curassoni TaxID=6186 RepID=A0A183KJ57_9TREM|nr:unnamed protein product [Schistosoma curassoni]